jgi:predicted ATP-grasp superfamily ATP-dependent carboligase
MLALGAGVLVQQWLPGAREAIWFIYADGRFAARFAQVAHRMSPPLGGTSVVRESIALPHDTTEFAEALVAAARLEGYTEVEFRRGADGRPHLMEINPRLSASVELAVRAGVDFPRLLYDWAVGSRIEAPASYPVGVRMRWLGGDIRWLRQTIRSKPGPDIVAPGVAIRRFLGDCVRPAEYDYAVGGDLRPALVATAGFLATAFRLNSRR